MPYVGASFNKYNFSGLFLILLTSLSSCGTTSVLREVSEEDKDPLYSYDGAYLVNVEHRGGRQLMGHNWYIDCSARDFSVEVEVKNSEASARFGDEVVNTFVDRNGKFRLEAPLDWKSRQIGGVSSFDGVRFVLQGVVHAESMEGRVVYARDQFNGHGCTYPLEITRKS